MVDMNGSREIPIRGSRDKGLSEDSCAVRDKWGSIKYAERDTSETDQTPLKRSPNLILSAVENSSRSSRPLSGEGDKKRGEMPESQVDEIRLTKKRKLILVELYKITEIRKKEKTKRRREGVKEDVGRKLDFLNGLPSWGSLRLGSLFHV